MRWRVGTLAAVVVLMIVVWRWAAPGTLALTLAAPTTESWVGGILTPPSREEITIPTGSGKLVADFYRPQHVRGALLLVHGLSREGRRQPDLERLARLLATHGLEIIVPQFDGLAAFKLTGREIDDIRAALRHAATTRLTSDSAPGGFLGIAGFSFGAGPALIAAAGLPKLRLAASFGGYADLIHVITYATTGVHDFGGQQYSARQEEYNRWKLLALLAPLVEASDERRLLEVIAQRKLANPSDDTGALERDLAPESRAMLALALNRRKDQVEALVARLPARVRKALDRLSPLPAVPRIRARLLVAHGMADDSIPFTESMRLAAAAGDRAHLALFETFHHTGAQPFWSSAMRRAADAGKLLRLLDMLLEP